MTSRSTRSTGRPHTPSVAAQVRRRGGGRQTLHAGDFFSYLVTRGRMSASPLPELVPCILRSFEPYIYSREECSVSSIRQRSSQTTALPSSTPRFARYCSSFTAPGFGPARVCGSAAAMWTSAIASSPSGIRSSSSRDLCPSVLRLTVALRTYFNARKDLPMPADGRSAFFASCSGGAISLSRLEKVFVRLREHAGIQSPPSRAPATTASRHEARLRRAPAGRVVPRRGGRPGLPSVAIDLSGPRQRFRHAGLSHYDPRTARQRIKAFRTLRGRRRQGESRCLTII